MSESGPTATQIASIFIESYHEENPLRLVFSDNKSRKTFDLSRSGIINLDSTEVKEKFAALLLMSRLLTTEDLRDGAEGLRTSREIDANLLQRKNISRENAHKVFSLQLSRMLSSLLSWNSFSCKKMELTETEPLPEKPALPFDELLLHLYRIAPPSLDNASPESLMNRIYSIPLKKLSILRSLPLNSKEGLILSRLSGANSLADVMKATGLQQEEFLSIIALLSGLGAIQETGMQRPPSPEPQSAPVLTDAPPSSHEGGWSISTPGGKNHLSSESRTENAPEPLKEIPEEVLLKIEELNGTLEDLKGKSYFEIFSVNPDTYSPSDLKSRYLELARYHPDRFQRFNSGELLDLAESITALINEAYHTLETEERAAVYRRELELLASKPVQEAPAGPLNPAVLAVDFFERGKNLIKAGKASEAITCLRKAVQYQPENPEYNSYLGFAMSRTPHFKRDAEQYFLKAIELSPMTINNYIHLGILYKEAKLYSKAKAALQEALTWDPDNRIAQKELEEVNKAMNPKSKGFLGGLFGR